MKRLNKLLLVLIMFIGFLPFLVKADNATIEGWALKCDKTEDIAPGEKVKCRLFGQVNNATSTSEHNIKYLITRMNGKAVKLTSVGSVTGLKYYATEPDEPYTGEVPRTSGSKCPDDVFGCYDWYKQNGVITRDLSSPQSTDQFATKNEFAYFEVEILSSQLTSDIDCGRVCIYADFLREDESSIAAGLVPTIQNSGCIELHLGERKICYTDGTEFYDSNGNKVTQAAYLKDCFACKKENNKYYDRDGKETDLAGYKRSCGCRIEGNTYYNDVNEPVTKDQYELICNPHCKCDSNGQCYDNNGHPITKEDYNRICNPKCYCDDNGQCYDDEGKPVTPEEYKKACACRIENGKYYDDTGAEVTEEVFQRKCNPHCYCNKEGQCYDSKGKPVTDEQYKKSCGCRKENGKFYDQNNNEVDEKTYKAKCIPPTGTFTPYASILTLLLASYGIFNLIRYYKNNKKIYKV